MHWSRSSTADQHSPVWRWCKPNTYSIMVMSMQSYDDICWWCYPIHDVHCDGTLYMMHILWWSCIQNMTSLGWWWLEYTVNPKSDVQWWRMQWHVYSVCMYSEVDCSVWTMIHTMVYEQSWRCICTLWCWLFMMMMYAWWCMLIYDICLVNYDGALYMMMWWYPIMLQTLMEDLKTLGIVIQTIAL